MKIEAYKNGFVRVSGLNRRQLDWVRYEIPERHRFFQNMSWYVHGKHVDDLKGLGASGAPATTLGGPDDYAVLHLLPTAPMAIIEAVWRALARLHHPDVGGDEELFKRLSAAYRRIKEKRD